MKQLELGSLWNLEACLVSWLVKKNQHVWEKILIEDGLHRRSHNIPLSLTKLTTVYKIETMENDIMGYEGR